MLLCRSLSRELSFRNETMTLNKDSLSTCMPFVSIFRGMDLRVLLLDINIRSFSPFPRVLHLPQICQHLT